MTGLANRPAQDGKVCPPHRIPNRRPSMRRRGIGVIGRSLHSAGGACQKDGGDHSCERVMSFPSVPLIRGLSEIVDAYDALLLDQWGVLHGGVEPYPGVLETLAGLRAAG